MSSGLSSSCETAMALSMDEAYEGKVFVVDNQRVSVTQYRVGEGCADAGRSGG